MPSKTLPNAGELIRESWSFFVKNWNESVKVTVWFLYVGLANFALLLLSSISPYFNVISIPATLLIVAVSLWAAIRTIQVVLELEAGEKPDMSKKTVLDAWKLVLPLLWIAILEMLIVLGGLVLLIIPGIYFGVVLSFSTFTLIEEKHRGTAALNASRNLVKGRFWATLWRLLAGSLVFGLALILGTGIIFALLVLIAGPSHFITLKGQLEPLAQGTVDLLQSIIQAATLPLFIGYQVKVYRALKRTA